MERLLLLAWLCLTPACVGTAHMDVVHSWRFVDYVFPSLVARDAMVRTGRLKPSNIALIDVDVWDGGGSGQKLFVTMPRLKSGIPATLATVTTSGALAPYPDWNWHREGNCEGITSVFRVEVDDCGRLWVLDTGTVDIFTNPRMICPPQLLVFNLHNDKLMGRYVFPDDVVDSKSLLVTIAVDTRDSKCVDTFAYIADVTGYKMIVFDAVRQKSWRVTNNLFYPYPLHGSFSISGVHFDLMDGILGLALGPIVGGDRRLYFHSLASVRESWVATSLLRNESLFTDGDGAPRSFHVSQHTRSSQSAAEAMSPSGVLFFGLLGDNAVACWNSRLPYTRDNIVTLAKDDVRLQFPSGIKLRNGYLWAITTRFQNYIAEQMDQFSTNFRILAAPLALLTHGTSCYNPNDNIGETIQFTSGLKYKYGKIWSLSSRLQDYIVGELQANRTNFMVVRGDAGDMTRGTSCSKRGEYGTYKPSGEYGTYRPEGRPGQSYTRPPPGVAWSQQHLTFTQPTNSIAPQSTSYRPFVFKS